uniref:Transmembrane protein 170B n=2 Tax=Euarchontoglires TaxID=314146 RepID=A0A8C9PFT7_SPEDA
MPFSWSLITCYSGSQNLREHFLKLTYYEGHNLGNSQMKEVHGAGSGEVRVMGLLCVNRMVNPLFFLSEMWYWIFLWALFSSLFVHGAAGVLMFVMLQRHRQGRVISVIAVSIGFLASVTGAMITSAAVAGIYRVAGKNMAPLEALVWGVGQTVLTLIISFSRILATL